MSALEVNLLDLAVIIAGAIVCFSVSRLRRTDSRKGPKWTRCWQVCFWEASWSRLPGPFIGFGS